jgi:ribosomal protein S18 acetylase RimI-like enzyme
MTYSPNNFTYKLAHKNQHQLILDWLEQPHIKEWLHTDGLKNLHHGLDLFFQNKTNDQHWIAYDHNTPFAYLLTSPADSENSITLDLFITDTNYIGKGYATTMIQQFLIQNFADKEEIFIDPEATNTRAIHVYKKVGFKIIGEFIATWHPVPHIQMSLKMYDLLLKHLKK